MSLVKENDECIIMYHIISISKTSLAAQKYNVKNEPDKFWERLPPGRWLGPVCYSSEAHDYEVFKRIFAILFELDANNLKYEKYNKPSDFVKLHLITDGEGNVALCNKHLIKQHRSIVKPTTVQPLLLVTDSGDNVRPRYSAPAHLVRLIKALFPQHTSNQISNSTPDWALNLVEKLSKSSASNNQQQQQQQQHQSPQLKVILPKKSINRSEL